jgi:hypothetical protein
MAADRPDLVGEERDNRDTFPIQANKFDMCQLIGW